MLAHAAGGRRRAMLSSLPGSTMSDEQFDKGLATRKQVMGEDFVARAYAGVTEFTAPLQHHITRNAWGDVWQRPAWTQDAQPGDGRDADRAGAGRTSSGAMRGALNNGATVQEIQRCCCTRPSTAAFPPRSRPSAARPRWSAARDCLTRRNCRGLSPGYSAWLAQQALRSPVLRAGPVVMVCPVYASQKRYITQETRWHDCPSPFAAAGGAAAPLRHRREPPFRTGAGMRRFAAVAHLHQPRFP